MSSRIRGVLTARLNRLTGYVNSAREIIVAAREGQRLTGEQMTELQRQRDLIIGTLPKVEEKQRDWERYYDALPAGPETEAEHDVYHGYFVEGVHFVDYLEQVDDLVLRIGIMLREEAEAASGTRSRAMSNASRRIAAVREALENLPPLADAAGEAQQAIPLLDAAARAGQDPPRAPTPLLPEVPRAAVVERPLLLLPPTPHGAAKVRLPTLEPEKFAGDPLKWQPFWQCFEASVHNSDEVAAVQKFAYLRSLLVGEAHKAVESYPVTAENYPLALDMLRRRFGDPALVAGALEAELMHLPRSGDSIKELRATAEAVERVCRQYSQLGRSADTSFVLTTVKEKFSGAVLARLVEDEWNWKRRPENAGRQWGMAELREALEQYLAMKEEVARRLSAARGPERHEKREREQQRRGDRNLPQSRAFAVVEQSQPTQGRGNRQSQRRLPPCFFCNGEHLVKDCGRVKGRTERLRIIREQNRCERCLRQGHGAGDCRRRRVCQREGCGGAHHQCICPGTQSRQRDAPRENGRGRPSGANSTPVGNRPPATVASLKTDGETEFLMTRRVLVETDTGKPVEAVVYLDPGSQVSFVTKRLLRKLGEGGGGSGCRLAVLPFHSQEPEMLQTTKHRLWLGRSDGGWEDMALNAIDFIGTKLSTIAKGKTNLVVTEREPDILLGLRDFWRVFAGREELSPDRYLIRTTLGDVLCGSWHLGQPQSRHIPVLATRAWEVAAGRGDEQVKEFWALETLGVRDNPHDTIEVEDARLESLLRKLHQDPELSKAYSGVFQLQRDLDMWEPAERRPGELEHYLPHHVVITHKVRVVFDASASGPGRPSLNDCLLRGPVILPDLIGVLFRFRACTYPVLADVEKAFLQLQLKESDREVVKFLWALLAHAFQSELVMEKSMGARMGPI